MTIARRGSRPIVVDGVAYHWSGRSRPTCSQAIAQGTMTFAVVNEASPGTTLFVTLDVMRPDNWLHAPRAFVTPAMVERAIRKALAGGWRSQAKGSPHRLAMSVAEQAAG